MAFQKGHPGFKLKGTKNKSTLLKEERRAIFDEEISKVWKEKIAQMRAEYVGDQFMGKAEDKSVVRIESEEVSPEIKALAEKLKELERPKLEE